MTADQPVADSTVRGILDDALERLLDTSAAHGGIAAYRRGTRPPVMTTAGFIDDAGDPITADRPFPIASVTKSFTAALLLDLAADGLVDLDAPISAWLDWPDADQITLRNLLTHTSGAGPWGTSSPDGTFDDVLFTDLSANHTLGEVVEHARTVPPVGPPGARTTYSNLNYILAGRIAELAGGAPYAQLLAERLTDPLGLTATK